MEDVGSLAEDRGGEDDEAGRTRGNGLKGATEGVRVTKGDLLRTTRLEEERVVVVVGRGKRKRAKGSGRREEPKAIRGTTGGPPRRSGASPPVARQNAQITAGFCVLREGRVRLLKIGMGKPGQISGAEGTRWFEAEREGTRRRELELISTRRLRAYFSARQ